MSRKTTKSILSRDEISLLINSEEPKNNQIYGNLYEVLLKISNLKAATLQQLIDLQLDSVGVAALTYNKILLIENVKGEWYVENHNAEDPDKKVKCGLCNTPNKYLFYIRNRINNKQLNVGSSCITNFPGIEGYAEYKYQLNKTIRTQKEIARRTEFHNRFPNCTEIIDSSSYYFDNLPILLSYELYFPLKDTVKNLRLIYTKYIKNGKTPFETQRDPFQLFKECVYTYNDLKTKADKFIENNINKSNVCKRSEIDWMLDNRKIKLMEQIAKNNGIYTIETLKEINSTTFITSNMGIFIEHNKSENVRFIKPKDDTTPLFFSIMERKIKLFYRINIKKFMNEIGSNCFFDMLFTFDKNDLFKVSKVEINQKNLFAIINYLSDTLDKIGYVILIDEYTNDIYLYKKVDKSVKELTSTKLIEFFNINFIQKQFDIYKFIGIFISKGWITFEEQVIYGIDGKINDMYYKQYIEPDSY